MKYKPINMSCDINPVFWQRKKVCVGRGRVGGGAVHTAAMNAGLYPCGHFRLPTSCSCQFMVSVVSIDTVFSVGRCSAKAAAAQYLIQDVHTLLHIFFQTERHLWYH